LPREIQFLVSCAFKPDSRIMISTNFALREVSTAAYDEEQTHLRSIVAVVDHGVWPMNFNEKKIDKKN
jgi:hypothetical protein